jgi:hypothetical protein
MRWQIALFSLACAGVLAACGDDDDGDDGSDAGLDGGESGSGGSRAGNGGGGNGGSSGSSGSSGASGMGGSVAPPPVECGGQTCMPPSGGGMLGTPCCTEEDTCGLQTMLAPGMCLPANAPGGIDESCPPYDVMGFLTWYGCCTPDGECGALAAGSLGCVPNSSLMVAPQSCEYDPNNTCTRLFEVTCDGAEDCGDGQECCGHYDGGYRKFVCADDCAAEQAEQGGTWSAACHPGDECATPDGGAAEYMCLANSEFLPDYLYRCRDTGTEPTEAGSTAAGEVNCGDAVCGAGEKCCISVPGLAVCVPSAQECTCVPEGTDLDAGTADAG